MRATANVTIYILERIMHFGMFLPSYLFPSRPAKVALILDLV